MSDLDEFLRSRGIPEDTIERLSNEKVDQRAICLLNDSELSKYIPKIGDRVHIRKFCQNSSTSSTATKDSLFTMLRKRMKMNESSKKESGKDVKRFGGRLIGNKNAAKDTRTVEFAWIHNGVPLRKSKGYRGKTLQEMSKKATRDDLLQRAKELFFPDGTSKHGLLKDMEAKIVDFDEQELPAEVTLGYITMSLGREYGAIRIYLSTTSTKKHTISNNASSTVTSESPENDREKQNMTDDIVDLTASNSTEVDPDPDPVQWDNAQPQPAPFRPCSPTPGELFDEGANLCHPSSMNEFSENIPPANVGHGDQHDLFTGAMSEERAPEFLVHSDQQISSGTGQTSSRAVMPAVVRGSDQHVISAGADQAMSEEMAPEFLVHSDQQIHFGTVQTSSQEVTPAVVSHDDHQVIHIRRVFIVQDMITVFKDPSITRQKLLFTYVNEMASDSSGVSRDVYCSFWTEFLLSASEGEDARVPVITQKWLEEEWWAIGRILLKGFLDHRFYPLKLAECFTIALIHGEAAVPPEKLMSSFLLYISATERDAVKKGINGNIDDDQDTKDDLQDLFNRMGASSIPGQDIQTDIFNMAHKELIQLPKYALEKMRSMAGDELLVFFPSIDAISMLYKDIKPTPRKVLKLIDANPMNPAEQKTLTYLEQFIRSQSDIGPFIRLVTGADILCTGKITIGFTRVPPGLNRRPIFHTCGPFIELPTTYENYPEFRAEMTNILQNPEALSMNIV